MSHRFCRPLFNTATRFLLVGNCGRDVGLEAHQIEALFSSFGPAQVDLPEKGSSYVFVTLPDIRSAQAALRHFTEIDISRRFIIRYADVKKPKQPKEEVVLYRDAEECGIPGLRLIKDYITEEEESNLMELLLAESSQIQWEEHTGRHVTHFGVAFDYATLNVHPSAKTPAFPDCVVPIVDRIEQCLQSIKVDQLTVNKYPPGVGLASHTDSHIAFTGSIAGLSTGSAAVMLFRKENSRKRLVLPRRSLFIMSDEARYCWFYFDRQHSLPPNRMEREDGCRISFTFRQARGYPCDCAYPQYCDSQQGGKPPTRLLLERMGRENSEQKDEICSKLENDHVHKVYDTIARHFSSTRFAVWPKVREFLESLPPRAVLADIGCGNGKYFNVRKDVVVFGFDRSEGLLKAAKDRSLPTGIPSDQRSIAAVAVSDALKLPLRDGVADAVLCVAVLHHISNIDRRLKILEEIVRVTKPQGRALITVWAQEQEGREKTIDKWRPIEHQDTSEYIKEVTDGLHGQDYFVPWHLPLHRVEGQIAAQAIESENSMGTINDEKRSVMFERYYHLYVEGELDRLCERIPNTRILESFFDKSNWCVIIQKTV